jgi:hypothetical protein
LITLPTIISRIPLGEQLAFVSRVKDMSNRLGGSLYDYLAAMDFESAHTMRPDITNSLGYVGLIQFGSQAASDLGTSTAALKSMTRLQQLEYVEKYFKMWMKRLGIQRITNFTDLYLIIFYPDGIKERNPDKPFASAKVEKANPALENSAGHITKNSIKSVYSKMYLGLYTSSGAMILIAGVVIAGIYLLKTNAFKS